MQAMILEENINSSVQLILFKLYANLGKRGTCILVNFCSLLNKLCCNHFFKKISFPNECLSTWNIYTYLHTHTHKYTYTYIHIFKRERERDIYFRIFAKPIFWFSLGKEWNRWQCNIEIKRPLNDLNIWKTWLTSNTTP